MAGNRPILVAGDDAVLRQLLAEQLQVDGEFVAFQAPSLLAAEQKILSGAQRFEAVILDLALPDGDGGDLCRRLRMAGVKIPIIILTDSDAENDVVRGLDAGANDFVSKPFRIGELFARLRAQLRGFENSDDAVFSIGPYQFKPSAKQLVEAKTERRIRLTEKEVAVLKYLYRAGTKPTSRNALLQEVWGYNAGVSTHTLETHIYRLRQKIEPDPNRAQILLTEGGGYRLDPTGGA
jgi:DNA-binding response OmpR family regulator